MQYEVRVREYVRIISEQIVEKKKKSMLSITTLLVNRLKTFTASREKVPTRS